MKKWTYCNDLSGREWIPDDTIPGRKGWIEDVPRRLYLGTPWGMLTLAPNQANGCQMWFPWKVKSRWASDDSGKSHYSDHIWSPITWHPRSRPPTFTRANIGLILKEINPDAPVLQEDGYIHEHEWLAALIATLTQIGESDDPVMDYQVKDEIRKQLKQKGVPKDTRRQAQQHLAKIGSRIRVRRRSADWADDATLNHEETMKIFDALGPDLTVGPDVG